MLWIAPPVPAISPRVAGIEQRIDYDGVDAAIALSRMLAEGRARGLVFGVIKSDGNIEMGATGCLFDNPLAAAGMAGRLVALLDSWQEHPSLFLP